MILALLAIAAGLALLVWSADRFIDGAAATAKHAGMPPLLIGLVVVGFGTSAPEMVVSALAAAEGNSGLALGNAYGSNITNIGLILGVGALLSPIAVQSNILRKELPLLTAIGIFSFLQLRDGMLSSIDSVILLLAFLVLVIWSVFSAMRGKGDTLGQEMDEALASHPLPLNKALWLLGGGLLLLIISSRILVWGAVSIAKTLGISDMIIGLTIVALGTSLPELAATVAASRKNEDDIALGNIIGSCMFNLLAVVGIAGIIHPLEVDPGVLTRDWPVLMAMTLALFVMAYGFKGPGRINRLEGLCLLITYSVYTGYLALTVIRSS